MNVQPGELATLIKAMHPQNNLRVCQIVQRLPDADGRLDRIWWLCEFPRPVKTAIGWMYFACLLDEDLRRIGLKVDRFRYPATHYQLIPQIANALANSNSFREASA